jgi:hypothetical protein
MHSIQRWTRLVLAAISLAAGSCGVESDEYDVEDESSSAQEVTVVDTSPCVMATASTWIAAPFATQTGTFSGEWDVTPASSGVGTGVGFSRGNAIYWSQVAAVVRFQANGVVQAINGNAYGAAVTIPYTANAT